MHVLYEESGDFKVGAVLADNETSLQVEAPHGKRSKVKASAVLLRFTQPAPAEMLRQAEIMAGDIDAAFLWECCGAEEFAFETLAKDYCGHAPNAVEAAAILIRLRAAPIYFHRKGKGRFRAAPADILRAALASEEKKRRVKQQIVDWAHALAAGRLPEGWQPALPELLYRPDRNKPEARALEQASEATGLTAARLFERAGALASTHDYHFGRFLFEHFPRGTSFLENLDFQVPAGLPEARVAAFSLDDAETTEIDDALSITRLAPDLVQVGIHIAAPALGFAPGSAMDEAARQRMSSIYVPGRKITMLPDSVVDAFTLGEGAARPALSIYFEVREPDLVIERERSVIESVPIAANLRLQASASLDEAFVRGEPPPLPFAGELHWLWRFAEARETVRGRPSTAVERPEYNFRVLRDGNGGERIEIQLRPRGTPLDKLVAELMILANSTWGRLLDAAGLPAIYRVQAGGKVRMSTGAGEHQSLGISHYAWLTSPLRRYVDLVNQWQLVALLRGEVAPFARNDPALLSAVHAFETAHAAYGEFQWAMERYWCLRWLVQEGVGVAEAEVLRENLVRFTRLPLTLRVPSLPDLAAGTRVELEVVQVDLLEAELRCRYRAPVS
ncbi:MAG: RNB domain-containing ribonuclease [Burkholderiales bacterium]|nr:RNB domain-containing ribonuclease [Burkholderiales bacterium]